MENKIESIYSLSPMQEGMLYHKLLNDNSTEYFIRYVMKLTGDLDIARVKESLSLLSEKYGVLRTAIVLPKKGDKPLQVVLRKREIELNVIDLTDCTSGEKNKKIEQVQQEDLQRGFDLQKDSLVRMTIIKLSPNAHLALWSLHHIILDGWCSSTVLTDFFRNYERLCEGEPYSSVQVANKAEKASIASFGEYIRWLEKQDKKIGMEYWNTLLDGYSNKTTITASSKVQATKEEMQRYSITADQSLIEKLKELSRRKNVTINTVLESALGLLLQKYNMNHDVVFGKVVSGRNADIVGIDRAVGLFINTVPVRVKTETTSTCEQVLETMHNQALDSSCYDFCSLADIQAQSNHDSELINVLFVFENYFVDEYAVTQEEQSIGSKLTIEFEEVREQTNYPLNFSVSLKDTLDLDIIYNPKLYSEQDIRLILEQYHFILQEIIRNPEQQIKEIDLISDLEKEKILGEFNDTTIVYPEDMNVVKQFEEQAMRLPDKIAVRTESGEITYRELNEKANQLAVRLREMGIGREDYV
ncbi:condensation domain-containing protein, partial [Bacillus mobilis]|nr:condensation domain-containing protein [Bacillus mobilis]